MNFEFSPGLIGYGAKGADGSAGINGMGIHYTDYNLVDDIDTITNRIQNNESLFSIAGLGENISGGRQYNNYEAIISYNGDIAYITDVCTGEYSDPAYPKFTTVSYFEYSTIDSDYTFQRYSNICSSTVNYIIDNVYTPRRTNYLSNPTYIYGIKPKNFARVEYSTVDVSAYNPFTVFSAGQYKYRNDHEAFAIVRNISTNTFRIGNSVEQLRNMSMIFDVSSLAKNSNDFTLNTSVGEILSSKEIDCPALYSGIFDYSPISFTGTSPNTTTIAISWDLLDFTPDPSIIANLVFYEKLNYYTPLVFHNIEASGTINISELTTDTPIAYYLEIIKNGWKRRSVTKELTVGQTPTLTVTEPADLTLDASFNGYVEGAATYTIRFSTTSQSGWNIQNPFSWITCSPMSGNYTTGDEYFLLSVAPNTGGQRVGYIRINSEAPTQTITITQGAYEGPTLTISPTNVAKNSLNTNCTTNVVTVTASAGNSWTAIPTESWILITGGSGTGNGSFKINCLKSSDASRYSTVLVSSSAPIRTVNVYQYNDCPSILE